MKNGRIKTDFDDVYEELNAVNEAAFQPSLFPTDNYISYNQLADYLNTYYFNTENKDTLLPPVDDNQGWEILGHLRHIEQDIPIVKAFSYAALARVCLFYNTYVVEHYLLNNVVDKSHAFAPDTNMPDDDDFMYLPSHEYLRGGVGYKDSDFVYTVKGRKMTADLKFKPSSKQLKKDEIWEAHGADFVYCYIVENNQLALYQRTEFLDESNVKARYTQKKLIDLEQVLPASLIPQSMLRQPKYNHWANVFFERNLWLKKQAKKDEEEPE
jgi:hypothetical protein